MTAASGRGAKRTGFEKWWKDYPRPEWANRGFLGLTGWSPYKSKPFVWIHNWTGHLQWDVNTAFKYGFYRPGKAKP